MKKRYKIVFDRVLDLKLGYYIYGYIYIYMTIYIIWFKYIQIYIIYTYRLDRSSCTLNVISLCICVFTCQK